jgi:hypothetical protein
VHDHGDAFGRQDRGDLRAEAAARTGDQSAFAGELQIHVFFLSLPRRPGPTFHSTSKSGARKMDLQVQKFGSADTGRRRAVNSGLSRPT